MPELKHTLSAGRMNKDLDERLVVEGEYRDANNIEITTSEGSNAGVVQTLKGNTKHSTMANFDNVTGSDSSGNFYVTDFSSGSTLIRDNFGWVGGLAGYQHSGQGDAYNASSNNVVVKEFANSFKFIDPEQVISSDMCRFYRKMIKFSE